MKAHQQALISLALALPAALVARADGNSGGLVSGYFASWLNDTGKGDLGNYDEVSFFAAITGPDGAKYDSWQGWSGGPELVLNPALAKVNKGTPTLLTVGGWGGSANFSSLVRTKKNRKKFARSIAKLVVSGNFSGVDISWDFPNAHPQDPNQVSWDLSNYCNEYDSSDTDNLLLFIKQLRKTLKTAMGKQPVLSASVPMNGFTDEDGQKLDDASAFVDNGALDYITVMTWDVASNYRNETGINAPLDDKCAPADQKFSIKSAIQYWTDTAQVPANKIQLGLPTYGKIFQTIQTDLVNSTGSLAYTPKNLPKTSKDDKANNGTVQAGNADQQGNDRCGIWRDYSSIYTYQQLVDGGFVAKSGEGDAGTWKYYWDDCTSSPFVYDKDKRLFITYDNPKSIQAKAAWAKQQGLYGIKLYDIQGDNGDLVKAGRQGWSGSTS